MDTVKVIIKYFIYAILFFFLSCPILLIIFPIGAVRTPTIADKNQIDYSVFQNDTGTISFLLDRESGFGIIRNNKDEKIPVYIYLEDNEIKLYEAFISGFEICQGEYIETWKARHSLEEITISTPKDSILGSKMKFKLYRFADLDWEEYATYYARLRMRIGDLNE